MLFGDKMTAKLIMVDLDGTLTQEVAFTIDECRKATPVKVIIDKVTELYAANFIVIYTARRDELLPVTLEWLRVNNIRYHAISNLKIPADVYVDDKMMSFEKFLEE